MNGLFKTTFFSTLMKALIKNPNKTKRMIEAGNFFHDFQIIKVLERYYNTQAAISALTLACHSLKQKTGESGAEFFDRINAAAMKLEKAGEVVSDAAKLTRLIHPNQGSGSIYDKFGTTIYTTPNITFDKASGLFEGMEHAGLVPVPPTDSVNYSNAQDKCRTSNKRKFNRQFNKKKSNTRTQNAGGQRYQSSRSNQQFRNFFINVQLFATIWITLLISVLGLLVIQ
jgi:hypothetical protein